jgi:hypothetical protein
MAVPASSSNKIHECFYLVDLMSGEFISVLRAGAGHFVSGSSSMKTSKRSRDRKDTKDNKDSNADKERQVKSHHSVFTFGMNSSTFHTIPSDAVLQTDPDMIDCNGNSILAIAEAEYVAPPPSSSSVAMNSSASKGSNVSLASSNSTNSTNSSTNSLKVPPSSRGGNRGSVSIGAGGGAGIASSSASAGASQDFIDGKGSDPSDVKQGNKPMAMDVQFPAADSRNKVSYVLSFPILDMLCQVYPSLDLTRKQGISLGLPPATVSSSLLHAFIHTPHETRLNKMSLSNYLLNSAFASTRMVLGTKDSNNTNRGHGLRKVGARGSHGVGNHTPSIAESPGAALVNQSHTVTSLAQLQLPVIAQSPDEQSSFRNGNSDSGAHAYDHKLPLISPSIKSSGRRTHATNSPTKTAILSTNATGANTTLTGLQGLPFPSSTHQLSTNPTEIVGTSKIGVTSFSESCSQLLYEHLKSASLLRKQRKARVETRKTAIQQHLDAERAAVATLNRNMLQNKSNNRTR